MNPDGSVDLYIRHESPGKDAEVLPEGEMYWPKETGPAIIDGSWKVPPVQRFM